MSESYQSLVGDFHRHRLVDANRCVALGVEERLDELPDPSLSAGSAAVQSAQALLERAEALDRSALDFEQSLDLDLLSLWLRQEVHTGSYEFNGRTTLQQLPAAGDDIAFGLVTLFANDPRPAGDRLSNITARIEMIPDYLETLLRRLHRPVKRWVNVDRAKVDGLPMLFANLTEWAEIESFADRARLKSACAAADEALKAYSTRLSALETTTNIHVGESIARRIVELRGLELSLEALHRVARDFMEDNRRQLEELRGRLADKYSLGAEASVGAVKDYLARRFAVDLPSGDTDDVIGRYQAEAQKIDRFLADRDLFPIPAAQEMKILKTPAFLEPTIPAGAIWPPPPFRNGIRTSLIYLTIRPEFMNEHTELGIPGMMVHEGIPGHHLHLSWAAMHTSTVRKHIEAMEQAEGWTTMLEDYMLDQGYMGDLTDEARFISALDIARIGARVGIDLFFMTGERDFLFVGVPETDLSAEDPFEAAGALLAAATGFGPPHVAAELNWYSMERGYPLSYLAGNHLVWALKRDVIEAQTGRSSDEVDREFHRAFLEAGNMPVRFLRKVFAHRGLL